MRYFIFFLLLLSGAQAHASYHFCKGNIKTLWIEGSGNVYIVGTWREHHTKICNINGEWKGVKPDVCKVWVGTAQLAYAAKSDVLARYDLDSIESCAAIPTYGAAPAPNYLMVTEFE